MAVNETAPSASDLNDSVDNRPADSDNEECLKNEDIEEIINQGKSKGMFVSGWEQDEDGVSQKCMDDILEQLLTAAENNNVSQIKSILSLKPMLIEATDADGYTALHRAAYSNSIDSVSFLLSAGANLNARTQDGWTPLHSASNWACYETVGILLSNGADVNSCTNGNLTPLHLAINAQESIEKTFNTVYYLLQAPGIDASVKSNAGDTPIMLARRAHPHILEIVDGFLSRR